MRVGPMGVGRVRPCSEPLRRAPGPRQRGRRVRLVEEAEQGLARRLVQPDPITPGPDRGVEDVDQRAARRRCWGGSGRRRG